MATFRYGHYGDELEYVPSDRQTVRLPDGDIFRKSRSSLLSAVVHQPGATSN